MSASDPPPGRSDIVFADGGHDYWSTHCRHERHDACNATELAPGVPRRPAQCKTCGSPCICECHVADTFHVRLELTDGQAVETTVEAAHVFDAQQKVANRLRAEGSVAGVVGAHVSRLPKGFPGLLREQP